MTDETNEKPDETGNLQGKVGYGKPPVANQFGGKKANPINRLGRKIRGKDALRKEWEAIWSEVMLDDKGNPIVDEITKKGLTRLRAQMRAMTTSTNVKKVELALSYTFGKPTEETKVDNTGEVVLRIVREETKKPDVA
jgi:hypothetical protein